MRWVLSVFALFAAAVLVLSWRVERSWPLLPDEQLAAALAGEGPAIAIEGTAVAVEPQVSCQHAPAQGLVCELSDQRAASPGNRGGPPLAWRTRRAAAFVINGADGRTYEVRSAELELEPGTLDDRRWTAQTNEGGLQHTLQEWWLVAGDPVVAVGVPSEVGGQLGFRGKVLLRGTTLTEWRGRMRPRAGIPVSRIALGVAGVSAASALVAWLVHLLRARRAGAHRGVRGDRGEKAGS